MSDKDLINLLCKDETFRESIESEYGPLIDIYPDYTQNILIYEFQDGEFKHSTLEVILKAIKDVGYAEQWTH
jgi:hypothetical protein